MLSALVFHSFINSAAVWAAALNRASAPCSLLKNKPQLRANGSASWKKPTTAFASRKKIWSYAAPVKSWARDKLASQSFASPISCATSIFCKQHAKKLSSTLVNADLLLKHET